MAYSSKIKLEIGEVPKTDDPKMLSDFIDIYNSIHILAQLTDQLIEAREKDNDTEGKTPDQLRPLTRTLNGKVAFDVKAGNIVTLWDYEDERVWIPGGPPEGEIGLNRAILGMVLEDGDAWTEVPIALGPGIFKLTGAVAGQNYYVVNPFMLGGGLRPGAGYLYTSTTETVGAPVAQGIATDLAMLYDSIVWYVEPPLPPDSGGGDA